MSVDLTSLDDGGLVAASIGGDRRAFSEIMRRHREALYRLIRGHVGDAEEALDVTQEVFTTAYRHLLRFDTTRPLRPWLARIAINRSRDWHRRQRLRRFFRLAGSDQPEAFADEAPSQHAEAEGRAELDRAWAAIAKLPTPLRETLLLRTVEGLSQAEAAEALGVTGKAIETRLRRARAQLKLALDGEG